MPTRFSLSLGICITPLLLPNLTHALDCRVREAEAKNPNWTCKFASQLMADNVANHGGDEAFRCVPASEFATWACLDLDTDARLCSDGSLYDMSVYLSRSNVSIDCADQTLRPTGTSDHSGFRTPYTRSLHNIEIRNCQVIDAPGYGIDLKRHFRADESCIDEDGQYGLKTSPTAGCEDALIGHSDIRIYNVGISNSSRIGIYVGQASRDISISDVAIDSAYIGVYLEASTAGARISRAVISHSRTREGIAVDSSRYNIIEDSIFEHNGSELFTGINLYKNAGEYEGQVCPVIRPWGADHNIIRYSHFYKDDVNVASRESLDTYANCSKYYYCSFNYRDRADENILVDNVFHEGAQLDMLDESFIVHGNRFESGAELELGGKQHVYNLSGTVAQNVFYAGSSVRMNESNWSALDIRNNMSDTGACASFGGRNQCGKEWTVVWGDQVLSAGLIAVLL